MPDELWMEVCDIVQETGIKIIPIKQKCKKAKWLSEKTLQIAVKRREVKRREVKRKDIHDSDNHDGVVPRLEPDILECEVKWA